MNTATLEKPNTQQKEEILLDLSHESEVNQDQIQRFQSSRRPHNKGQWLLWAIGWAINNDPKATSEK